jgi:hypothetical protein
MANKIEKWLNHYSKNGWACGEILKNGWATCIGAERASARGTGRAAWDRDAWRYYGGGTQTGRREHAREVGRGPAREAGWGPVREAGTGGTQGGRAHVWVGVAGSIGRLVGWFDLWVQVVDQWIHHSRWYIYIWCYYSSHRVINRYVQSPESPTDRAPRVPTPSPVHARTRPHARARNPVGKPGQLAC